MQSVCHQKYVDTQHLAHKSPSSRVGKDHKQFCLSSSEITADRPPPLSGPSAGIFPAEMYLGKTAITLSSDVQIRWSWTLWKANSEGYTTQLNTWSKTQWINTVFHSKRPPNFRRTPKNLSFSTKLININSNSFSFANVPTPPREHHHVHVLAFHNHFQRIFTWSHHATRS